MTVASPTLQDLRTSELLSLSARILEELRNRRVVRSSNNPVADYTEWLVAKALSLKQLRGSTTGCDAVDPDGRRYEIKGRRLTRHNTSTQLSAIRGLDLCHFDLLAGVLYDEEFLVTRACLIPYDVVKSTATYRKHVNGWTLYLRPTMWEEPGVIDISGQLKTAQVTADS
jgi:hypothetical protein